MNVRDIKIILFDLDGVITSEKSYFKCAAATVLNRLGFDFVSDYADKVLCGGRIVKLLKNMQCNSNWDLSDLIYQAAHMLGFKKNDYSVFERVYDYFYGMRDKNLYELYDVLVSEGGYGREHPNWKKNTDEYNRLYYEKYISVQETVVGHDSVIDTLRILSENYILGIGTGRPSKDADAALDILKIRKFFEPDRIITYDDVQMAEKKYNVASLGKPSPYIFLKGMNGRSRDDGDILKYKVHTLAENTLVVGDSASDMMAAKAAGAHFCAVLTGPGGASARAFFEENGADAVLDDVTHLPGLMRG